jgi:hypothetical protein
MNFFLLEIKNHVQMFPFFLRMYIDYLKIIFLE